MASLKFQIHSDCKIEAFRTPGSIFYEKNAHRFHPNRGLMSLILYTATSPPFMDQFYDTQQSNSSLLIPDLLRSKTINKNMFNIYQSNKERQANIVLSTSRANCRIWRSM